MKDTQEKTLKTESQHNSTDLALRRTLLAYERTFSAWLRTGLASTAAGIAITRFLDITGTAVIPRLIGIIFIVMSGIIYLMALLRYHRGRIELEQRGFAITRLWVFGVITMFLLSISILGLILLI